MSRLARLYPEIAAGGFSRIDGTVAFYSRVNALLSPDMTVLDYGAGRGRQLQETDSPYRTGLARLQGKVAKVVGVDIDDAVLENPFMDEKHVIDPGAPLPFPDNSFDLVLADWVLEHVADPAHFAAEVGRVLKPGGWFCARTPNRWGMIGIGANLIPNRLHVRMLGWLQPERKGIDVFPTTYKLNTRRRLRRYFPGAAWEDVSFIDNGDPPYVQRSVVAMLLVALVWRLLPSFFYAVVYVFIAQQGVALVARHGGFSWVLALSGRCPVLRPPSPFGYCRAQPS